MVAPDIALDLQIEILKMLPGKSLARFKCVSKLWSSLIHSQGYLFPSPPRLYIGLVQAPGKDALLSLPSTSKNTAFDLDMMMDEIGGVYLLEALRGLILCKFCGQACIYNPTTGQRLTLPPIIKILVEETDLLQHDYFLGYDPVLDQYKVVFSALICQGLQMWNSSTQHWVFVLEAGSSWKRIEFDHPIFPMKQKSLCVNGVIYYLASIWGCGYNIICFDLRYEEFNTIQLPHAMSANLNKDHLGLIEYGGKPTIFDYIHLKDPSGLLNLWVLEDVGKWSNKSLVLQPCQMHFFPDNIFFRVIGTTQNGEVVLQPYKMYYPYYILYYDLYKNDVRRVDIRGTSDYPLSVYPVYLTLVDTESIMKLKI